MQFKRLTILLLILGTSLSQAVMACGGFFCDFIPINQAGEQIIFRQDGGQTTAMIKIDYVGNAEDFGWVLPVPQTPEISLGSDTFFTELETITRPQFILERTGQECQRDNQAADFDGTFSGNVPTAAPEADSGVVIEKTLSVGPFDAQVVSSDDPEALAIWLADNNLDLDDQGESLLAPYIDANSKFVVLKLKSNVDVGSIQPIILEYASDVPVIPMTLTAIAAEDDMGVLVWLLGAGRGVPENFNHVTPNYTRLNWFSGTRSAYLSYQSLITDAMDESGGQGFATDFAGRIDNITQQVTNPDAWVELFSALETSSDAAFIERLWGSVTPFDARVRSTIRSLLPAPDEDESVYEFVSTLEEAFSAEALAASRIAIRDELQIQLIDSLQNALDLFADNPYMTRLYTTLSANDMTVNPQFVFNTEMPDQALARNATLAASCDDGESKWTLTLGEGTGREDEIVIDGTGWAPFAAPEIDQEASWRVEKTSASADPVILDAKSYETATIVDGLQTEPTQIGEPTFSNEVTGMKKGGGGSMSWTLMGLLLLTTALRNLAVRRSAIMPSTEA